MEKNKKRGERRHHRERREKMVREQQLNNFSNYAARWKDWDSWLHKYTKKNADNPHPCSCYMCRNLRESEGETFQEIHHRLREKDEY